MSHDMLLIGGATPRTMEKLEAEFSVHKLADIDDIDAFLSQNGAAITAVATNGHDGVPANILAGLPNLKIISCYGVGYDAIDVASAVARRIIITHTPNVLNDDVANTAIMHLLAVSRNLVQEDQHVRSGQWVAKGNLPLATSMEHKTVGIIGLGRIGLRIAQKLAAFDCNIAYHSRNKRNDIDYQYYDNLVSMARDCWAVIAITPGGAATHHMVNGEVMNAIGPDGIFINVGRGSAVDQDALVRALQEGRLGKAGLDVFADEPNVPDALIGMDNVILTPHIASATVETRQAMGDLTVENLISYKLNETVISPVPECAHLATVTSG